jgi:uncharacterized sodium:solute symporter family permease YidK
MDVYRPLVRPDASQRELVLVGRVLTIGVGVIALGVGLAVAYFRWTIFDTMVTAFGFFLPPTVLPMLGGLLSRRLSSGGVLVGFFAGIVIGLGFIVARSLCDTEPYGLFAAASLAGPAVGTILVLMFAAFVFPAKGNAARVASDFIAGLARPAVAVEDNMPSPLPIAGLVVGIMGVVLAFVGFGLASGDRLNLLTVSVGASFFAVGLFISLGHKRHLCQGKNRIVVAQTADSGPPCN